MKAQTWKLWLGFAAVSAVVIACEGGDPTSPAPPQQPVPAAVAAAAEPVGYTPVEPSAPLPSRPPSIPIPAASAPAALHQPTAVPIAESPPKTAIKPGPAPPSPQPDHTLAVFPVTVEDSAGNPVVFDSPPERIVAFDSAVVEILFAIGEGDRVVGTHDFVTSPPEADDIQRVGGAFNMDIEATVALEPDLVFIFFDRFKEDLERAGLKVLYVETLTDDFNLVADRIRQWGDIVGNPVNAEAVATDFEKRVQAVTETMDQYAGGPSVFQDEGALWTPGQGTLIQQVFDLLKLENIAADVVGYEQISPEVIVQRDPSVIIASYGDTISGDPVFQEVMAVRNRAVLVPSSDALSIAGPRFVEGIEELAQWVYPGLFP